MVTVFTHGYNHFITRSEQGIVGLVSSLYLTLIFNIFPLVHRYPNLSHWKAKNK